MSCHWCDLFKFMYFLSKWFRSSETAISVQFILNISNPPLYIMRLLLNSIPSYLVNFFQLVAQTRFSRDSRPGVLDQGVFIGNIEINGKTSFRPSHVPVDNISDWHFSLLVIIMLEIYNLLIIPSPFQFSTRQVIPARWNDSYRSNRRNPASSI